MAELWLKRYFLLALATFLLIPFLPLSNVHSAQVTLAWDPNTEPDLAGYRVHYGTASRSYQAHLDAGLNTTYTVSNLPDGGSYFFAVTAYDSSGNESAYSGEVSYSALPAKHHFDYDGDKTTEVSAYHLPTNQFLIDYLGSLGTYGWGGSDSFPLVWDYNGDGKSEISIYHIPSNRWFVKGYPGEIAAQFGSGGEDSVPVPGDYDGNGVMQMAYYHSPTNRWHVFGRDPVVLGWGGAACIPLPGDYDGDGKTDMMIYHLPTNQWLMYGVGNLGQFGWGGTDSIPAPADYDGDGAMDIAVYHRPSNQWLVKGFPGENMGQYGWGGAESFPIPGDYDGDGAFQRAFYRPAENAWHIEGEPAFVWGWGGPDLMPITSQTAVYNWFRFVLGKFQ